MSVRAVCVLTVLFFRYHLRIALEEIRNMDQWPNHLKAEIV
jgi:hypothetical protein